MKRQVKFIATDADWSRIVRLAKSTDLSHAQLFRELLIEAEERVFQTKTAIRALRGGKAGTR